MSFKSFLAKFHSVEKDNHDPGIQGICAGIARKFEMPKWKIRLLFLIILAGGGLILYIALAIYYKRSSDYPKSVF